MQIDQPTPAKRAAEVAAVVARFVLGACFLYMGFSKAVLHDPAEFLKQVHQYEIISSPLLLNSIASTLPWFEMFCGLLLLAGIAVRGTALVALALLVPFTALVLRRALAIASARSLALCAVKFDCGCGSGEVFVCHKLTENCILIALALWLTLKPSGLLCACFALLKPSKSAAARATASESPA